MGRRTWLAAALITVTVAAGLAVDSARHSASAQITAAHLAAADNQARPVQLSLLTGDRVTLFGDGRFSVNPRPGVYFLSYRVKQHRYVIPSDALPLLRAGRLDRRLFDLFELRPVANARPGVLPLLVSGRTAVPGLVARQAVRALRGFTAAVADTDLARQWPSLRTGLTAGTVWLDAIRKPTLDVSVPLIGAPAAWAGGYDGTGVTVGVLDTGIDSTHPDLTGKVVGQRNFTEGTEDDPDRVGHGTHVASTIAGTGAGSTGRYRGVAPGASLLDAKVCVDFGCPESWILAGMQWAAESGAKVINLSLGGPDVSGIDPLEQAVDDLTAQYGALFVVAAGNDGADGTVESPGTANAAITVGASTKTDELADFSSRGPSADADAVKPDIIAPGVSIVAARGKDGQLGEPGELYTTLSGTSMATPHVAGAAAILTQEHPEWTPQQRKAALMAAAKPLAGLSPFAQGAGRVDVARAIRQGITTAPASVSFGLQEYPHNDDPIRTETIVYHNDGGGPVTLNLSLAGPVPTGMFSLSATALTVAAGGEAAVDLSADTRMGGDAFGGLGGEVTATSGDGVTVQTPFGVVREPLMYRLRVNAIQRDGAPSDQAITIVTDTATGQEYDVFGAEGELRLPPGVYSAWSWISEGPIEQPAAFTQLTYPRLVLNTDTTIDWDARMGKGFSVTVPDHTARFSVGVYSVTDAALNLDAESFPTDFLGLNHFYTGRLGPTDVDDLVSTVNITFGKPDVDGRFDLSPYLYHVGAIQVGTVMQGLTDHVRASQLATVTAQYKSLMGLDGTRLDSFGLTGVGGSGAIATPFPLPLDRTEYFAGNAQWQSTFVEAAPDPRSGAPFRSTVDQYPTTYAPAGSYREVWNRATFGPSMGPSLSGPPITRDGDTIVVAAALIGDGDGRYGINLDSGHVALYRGDTLIGDVPGPFGAFPVAPSSAQYRLEASAQRAARLSTRVDCVWTFESATTPGSTELPGLAVGFRIPADENNVVPSGGVLSIPVTVTRSGDAGTLSRLSVDMSTDDGATWRSVRVVGVPSAWTVLVPQPHRAGYVSLRATGSDNHGTTVQETIIRAYQLT